MPPLPGGLTGASYAVADNTAALGGGLAWPAKMPFKPMTGPVVALADGYTYRLLEWCEDGSQRVVGTYNLQVDQPRVAPATPRPIRPSVRAVPR